MKGFDDLQMPGDCNMTILTLPAASARPDYDELHRGDWHLKTITGSYVVAWRNSGEEVVFIWRDGSWQQLASRSATKAA